MRSIILTGYLLLLVYVVFFSGNDYRFYHVFSAFGSLNLVPFKDKYYFLQHPEIWGGNNMQFFLKELFGNLLLLSPLPLILLWKNRTKTGKQVIAYGFLLSISIEALQFITGLGNADIDDVLLNTFGVILGVFIMKMIQRLWHWA